MQNNNFWSITFLVLLLALGVYFLVFFESKEEIAVPITENQDKTYEFCFADIQLSASGKGLEDEYTLRFLIDQEKVKGEIRFLPAEKDGKIGKFEGTVGAMDPTIMGRTIDGWWNTYAEGMNAREEVRIVFGDGSASIGAGEMIENSGGMYVYKDKNNLAYSFSLSQIDCGVLDERASVEMYLKENIGSLSPTAPVLGGKWYVLYSSINTTNDTGYVVYEDGHIMAEEAFSYTMDENRKITSLTLGMILSGSICEEAGGNFDSTYGECTGVSASLCANMGGEWNECASACRHDPKAEICTMQCVAVCVLPSK